MLNNNGVKEIQRYAFNGSSLEEVYANFNYCTETHIGWNSQIFVCNNCLAGWTVTVGIIGLFKMFYLFVK